MSLPASRRRPSTPTTAPITALTLALATALAAVLALTLPPPGPAAAAPAPDRAHPYSAPVWFPLRQPAQIGCAAKICSNGTGHGYWALDLVGRRGQPVHAAGSGVARVGEAGWTGCSAGGERDGNWVWIDHGGGVTTRYHHLDTVTVTDGQLVTPATRIGTLGSTGDTAPCTTSYLHFEVRHGGVKGQRVDPGHLVGCLDGRRRSVLTVLGASSWNDRSLHPTPRRSTPTVSTGCADAEWSATPPRPTIGTKVSRTAIKVHWGTAPDGVDTVAIGVQVWRPSLKRFAEPVWTRVDAAERSVWLGGQLMGREHRVVAHYVNRAGHSRASATATVIPSSVPATLGPPRYAEWKPNHYLRYGWQRPDGNGRVVDRFEVAWKCARDRQAYGATKTHRQSASSTYLRIDGVEGYAVCRIKVRSHNVVGWSPWSPESKVTPPR